MELPPYRMRPWKTTLLHMWDKCAQYLRKMGGMILIASIVVWFLSYYPRERTDDAAVTNYENSYLGRIGQACEPVFTPLGLNWKAGVALISGISPRRSSSLRWACSMPRRRPQRPEAVRKERPTRPDASLPVKCHNPLSRKRLSAERTVQSQSCVETAQKKNFMQFVPLYTLSRWRVILNGVSYSTLKAPMKCH